VSLRLHAELGSPMGEALVAQRLAELAVGRGDAQTADAYLRRGLQRLDQSSMPLHLVGRLYGTLALNALEQGDVAGATAAIEAAARASERYGNCPTCGALLHPVAAQTFAALGDPERGEPHAQAATQVAGYWESQAWRAMAELARGALARARQEPARAHQHFLDAAAAFELAEQPYEAARALLQAGLCRADSDPPRARAMLAQAETVFHRLGAARAEARARHEIARL